MTVLHCVFKLLNKRSVNGKQLIRFRPKPLFLNSFDVVDVALFRFFFHCYALMCSSWLPSCLRYASFGLTNNRQTWMQQYLFPITGRRREILRLSCVHFSDSFHRTEKDFKEQASHRRDGGRKNIDRSRVESRRIIIPCTAEPFDLWNY